MDNQRLNELKKYVLKKFANYLKAEQKLATEDESSSHIFKYKIENLRKVKQELKKAESEWEEALTEFALSNGKKNNHKPF